MRLSAATDARWDERLHNWAGFMRDRRGLGVKISSAYSLVPNGPPGEGDGIPGLLGDAMDTNRLVLRLEPKMRCVLWYRYATTLNDQQSANEMQCHRVTFVNFVRFAKEELERLHRQRFHVAPIESARVTLQQA